MLVLSTVVSIGDARTIDSEGGPPIANARTIDSGDCLLVGIVRIIGFEEECLLVGIVGT